MDEGTDACEAFFNSKHIKTLFDLNKDQPFDLLITEYFNTDCVLGLAYKLNITKFIGMSSCALMPWHYDRVGLPDTPSYIPNEFVGFSSRMSLSERIENWLVVTATKIGYR
jgi:glucuronosyltransferase